MSDQLEIILGTPHGASSHRAGAARAAFFPSIYVVTRPIGDLWIMETPYSISPLFPDRRPINAVVNCSLGWEKGVGGSEDHGILNLRESQ